MKKMRIMVLALMVMAMAAGLLSGPGTAYAEGTTPEIVLGAGEIAKATSTARNYTVWFGKYNNNAIQWRVLSGGGSADPDDGANLPVSGMGEALLISKQVLDVGRHFKEDCSSNQWAGSDAQAWCMAFWSSSDWLTAAEKRAVNATTVNEQNNSSGWFYRGGYKNEYYSAAPLNGEHIFFLSAREADKLFTGDSDRQAQSVSVNQSWWWWWLRSPLTSNDIWSGYVGPEGWVFNSRVDFENGARPAFNLNLSSVLFSSRIQSNPYKLTLADSNRTIGIRAAITRDSATQITVPYTKDSGSNHVSLLITNKNDSWTAGSGWSTGAVKQDYATAAVSETNGTVTFTLPDNYETNKGNWKVWLLAEQVNGEHETDYASAPVAITVPAYMPKVAYVDAKGNTPANSPVVCTPVTASDTTWGAAGETTWYAVTDSVTITNRVEVQGSVNLILCDGKTLKAEKGITVSGDNNSLTIWAQSNRTGKLYAGTTDGTDLTCQDNSAGIGGGKNGVGGEVTVNGGTVNATGGVDGAGIGGGYYGAGGKVTINGGTVNATGGNFGAGIGGGDYGAGGKVTINGGTVNATGGVGGAGIGGGEEGAGDTVKITGGTVYAQGHNGSQAIGHGNKGIYNLSAGSLEIYAGAKVTAGEDDSSASLVQDGTARVDACRDNMYAAIEPCENHSYTKYKNITDTTHTPVCAYCLNEGTATSHVYQDGECACGKQESYNVTLHTNGGTIASGKDVTGYTHGTGAALPTAADISWTGFTFNGWFDNENLTGSAVTAISATDTGNKIYWAKWTADPATAPVFTTQPQSVKLGLNAAGGNALTAATESISGHTITYQWYVNTSNSNDGGTPITGANAASYAAPTDELGKKYYYCVATATRDDNGQTASTKSDPAAVEVLRFITHTVTFEVVGGSWDDEDKTTANKTVEFTYPDDEDFAPVLQAGQVPAVGSSPDAGHLRGGTWTEGDSVVTMPPDEAIRRDRTFTFTYTAKGQSAVAKAPEAKTLTYNGAAQALVTAGTATDGTMLYALGTETAPGTDWSGDIPERTDAGTYYVWYKAQGDATHLDTEPKPVSAGIAPKSITGATVTLDKTQLGYTSAEQTVTVTGVAIDGLTLTENDYDVTGNKGTDAGDYTVTVTGKGNFQDTATVEWKIVEAGMTLSAPDVSATYDGQPHGITVTVTEPKGAAIKFKDEAGAYTLDASPAITNAGSLVVGYQITADNYLTVTGSATVTVTPKAATVTASAQTVREGESIQTGTDFATLTDALSGHTLSAVTLTAENGKIVPSAAKIQDAKGNDVTGNYDVSYQPGALTALGKISYTVTLKVVHGTWRDGTREDKTIVLTGNEGDELRLNLTDLPGVTKPDEGYDFATGAWSPYDPPTIYNGVASGDPITQDMTFTFTYGEKTTELIMVTLKVVHGEWGDELGGRDDRTIFLEGPIGEELRLQFNQIPNVDKPDEGYSAATGSWDKEPPFTLDGENYGDLITEDTVYTYTYGKIQDQPAGSETGNTETKPGAPVLGATNMDEVVKSVVEAIKNGKLTDVKDEVKQALSQPGAIVTLTLVSTPLADNEIPAQDKNALDRVMQTSGYDGYTAFDLSLLLTVKNPATGETVTEYLHASSKEVTFTLNVPDNLKKEGRTFFLLHTANGITNVVGSAQNPGPLNGRSSNFSTYAIAYKDAVATERFTFKKVWMGSKEDQINFKVYYPDGKAYDGTVNKDKVTGKKSMEWTFDLGELPVGCYVVEEPVAGYTSRCVNVGEHAADRDRCYNGGTIINKKIPKTGDEEPLLLWAGMIALGAVGLTATLVIGKKRKVHK